jgi:hypothetical protein
MEMVDGILPALHDFRQYRVMAGNRAFRSYGFADLAPGEIMA